MALCTCGSEPTIIVGDFQHQLHQHVGTQHPPVAHQPCCWAGGFHAQQRLCLAPAVCMSFRRRVAGPHVGQSAPHLPDRQANPFCQRGLVLRPPRCWLNINLADYYDHMQHLISQIWLNGLVSFSLSHAAPGEASPPPELPRSPHIVLHHKKQKDDRLFPKPPTESMVFPSSAERPCVTCLWRIFAGNIAIGVQNSRALSAAIALGTHQTDPIWLGPPPSSYPAHKKHDERERISPVHSASIGL